MSRVHSNLEGMSNCTKCHELGQKVDSKKCLNCHSEIKELINQNRGYHSSVEVTKKECWDCHSEHHGRNFEIIRFDTKNFDHTKTGYPLLGKHKSSSCNDCHQEKNILNKKFKSKKTYLGLDTKCQSCHYDYHQSTLGNDCLQCHSYNSFRPAEKFNHQKSKFNLTGKHLEVKCEKCHKIEIRNDKEFQKFRGLKFSNCNDCHVDVHNTRFGNDCQKCHNTNSFLNVNQSKFNHDITKFPLTGKHAYINCSQCHGVKLSSKPKHEKCSDCHSEYHNSEFITRESKGECSECHSTTGFSPSKFTVELHQLTKFKLTGKHLAIPCYECHFVEKKYTFKIKSEKCSDCHNNIHLTELDEKYLVEKDCLNCHQVEGWEKINFDHSSTGFNLVGKHSVVNCNSCHRDNQNKIVFNSVKKNCSDCHLDIHVGQFNQNGVTDCSRCHTFDNWKPESFNHNSTRFPLTGAHSKIDCNKCHKTTLMDDKKITIYKFDDIKCAVCHT